MPTPAPKAPTVLGHLGLFYAAAIWGATFFVVKGALAAVDPLILVGYRFLIAGGLLLAVVIILGRNLTAHLGRFAILAVILWTLYISQTVGLQYTTASNSGFITGLFIAFVPILLRLLFRRRPTIMEVIASAVSLVGLWILTGGLRQVNVGDMLTLISAMTYALHLLYSDKYLKEGLDPWVMSCQQFLLVGALSIAAGWVTGRPFAVRTAGAMWVVIFLALLPTASAFVIQMLAQRIIAPVRVSLVFAFEPVFAGVFAWTLGGEPFILRTAGGGLLIFLGLILSALPDPPAFRPKRAPTARRRAT
ncbi:MAG TPA: DMT family transporter [candidate division Zixibacteria bacterium]|nr:DMT family transporter [candidate division Zixibacteria bacterium]